jgi:hypothetical protein
MHVFYTSNLLYVQRTSLVYSERFVYGVNVLWIHCMYKRPEAFAASTL